MTDRPTMITPEIRRLSEFISPDAAAQGSAAVAGVIAFGLENLGLCLAPAPAEKTDVTPEMIQAAMAAMKTWPGPLIISAEFAGALYRAMEQARKHTGGGS